MMWLLGILFYIICGAITYGTFTTEWCFPHKGGEPHEICRTPTLGERWICVFWPILFLKTVLWALGFVGLEFFKFIGSLFTAGDKP